MVRREVCNWKWGIVVIVSWVWKVFAGVVADIDVGSFGNVVGSQCHAPALLVLGRPSQAMVDLFFLKSRVLYPAKECSSAGHPCIRES